ncbi:hypothetical protein IAR55_006082 [Kwoniella newhampshirensis]|uniref:Uncharacterized protein n=1 Tax=Kwoniella newhampshirensis TaxID=1651941 RepID=A0AAW0YUR1_9TREE
MPRGGSASMITSRPNASRSASSSRNASPAPSGSGGGGQSQPIDAYRPISTHVKKHLVPLLPAQSTPPNLPTLLSLDPTTYSSRLFGKTLLLTNDDPSSLAASGTTSHLVKGKKRNRGNPAELAKARLEAEVEERRLKGLGLSGLRRVKKRLGGVIKRGDKIDYTSLIPLHHLHTLYLLQLLAFPPLPSSSPSSSSNPIALPTSSHTNTETILSKLSKADFTGIQLLVTSSRNASLVGLKGIVIEETAGTFRFVTVKNEVKVIPKDGTMFRLSFPAYSPGPTSTTSSIGSGAGAGAGAGTDSAPGLGINSESELNDEEEDNPYPQPVDLTAHLLVAPRMEIALLGSSFVYKSADRAGRKFRPAQGGGGGSGWGAEWLKSDWSDVFDKLDEELRPSSSVPLSSGGSKGKKRKENSQPIGDKRKGSETGRRKRGKSRRKDPPAGGGLEVF